MSVVVQNFAAAIEGWFLKRDLNVIIAVCLLQQKADILLKSTGWH